MVEIRNWSIKSAPVLHLTGVVTGHPKIEDGLFVKTTVIHDLNWGNRTVETRNTLYKLVDHGE